MVSDEGTSPRSHNYGNRTGWPPCAAEALIANVPVLLTTDRRTFWKHRVELDAFGLAVMRPTELLKLYEPYWEALDEEFMRRRETQR